MAGVTRTKFMFDRIVAFDAEIFPLKAPKRVAAEFRVLKTTVGIALFGKSAAVCNRAAVVGRSNLLIVLKTVCASKSSRFKSPLNHR